MKNSKRDFSISFILLALLILSGFALITAENARRGAQPFEGSVALTSFSQEYIPIILTYSFVPPRGNSVVCLDIMRYENGDWQLVRSYQTIIGRQPIFAADTGGDIRLLVYGGGVLETQTTGLGTAIGATDGVEAAKGKKISVVAPEARLTSGLDAELPIALVLYGDEEISAVEPELSSFRSFDSYESYACVYAVVLTFEDL